MNDFTKEELGTIFLDMNHNILKHGKQNVAKYYLNLRDKVESMIDNYCEHDNVKSLSDTDYVYRCSDYDKLTATSKSKKNRYITTDELISRTLTPNALKIYMTLRFEVDLKKDVASVKITAQEIADKAGVGRTTAFKAFNELESAGLLQRQETRDRRNTFWVAKELGYFTKIVQPSYQEQPNA